MIKAIVRVIIRVLSAHICVGLTGSKSSRGQVTESHGIRSDVCNQRSTVHWFSSERLVSTAPVAFLLFERNFSKNFLPHPYTTASLMFLPNGKVFCSDNERGRTKKCDPMTDLKS